MKKDAFNSFKASICGQSREIWMEIDKCQVSGAVATSESLRALAPEQAEPGAVDPSVAGKMYLDLGPQGSSTALYGDAPLKPSISDIVLVDDRCLEPHWKAYTATFLGASYLL